MTKKDIVRIAKMLYQKGFLPATDGNISIRTGKNKIFITPSRMCKGFLKESDILTVNYDGKVMSAKGTPSIETKMHIFIYKNRPNVNAIIHAHPPIATTLSTQGKMLENKSIISCALLGSIPVAPFAMPGTSDVIKAIKPYVKKHNTIVLAHHGTLTYDGDITKAYLKTEALEYLALTHILAKIIGKTKKLTADKLLKISSLTKNCPKN